VRLDGGRGGVLRCSLGTRCLVVVRSSEDFHVPVVAACE